MKLIPLTQGQFTQVDDSDYEYLNQFKWFAEKNQHGFYAKRTKWINGKKMQIKMQNFILNVESNPKTMVDHKDRNRLNNQRDNLRHCTITENNRNRSPKKGKKYLGTRKTRHGTWVARIGRKNNIQIYLGTFKTEEEAAMAYDKKALELYGEFANLNFK